MTSYEEGVKQGENTKELICSQHLFATVQLRKERTQRRRTGMGRQTLPVEGPWETDARHCEQSSYCKGTLLLGWDPLDENVTRR